MILTMPFDGAPKNSSLIIAPDKMLEFGRAEIEKFINQTVVPDGLFGDDKEEVQKQLIWFYVDRNFSTDADITSPSTPKFCLICNLQCQHSKRHLQTDESPYYFGFSLVGQFDFNENDKKLQRIMVNCLANFIKPLFRILEHLATSDQEHPFGYFDMKPEPVLKTI
uniref:Uncharacterized protein n=1 Tax=Ditylenchus dipsaci TaxID=166011 RepID=A0A915E8E1_9BILA